MSVTGGSGRRQAAEVRASAPGAPGSVTIGRSASEERARQQHGLRAGRPSALAGLGRKALSGLDIPSLLEEAVHVVAGALDVPHAKILELLPDGSALLLRAGVGWRDGYVGRATVGAGAESQAGFTLLSDKTVVVEDVHRETRFQAAALLLEHGVVSGMSTIIRGRHRPFGVLGAHDTRRRSFTQDDVDFLRAVASIVGIAIERGQAEEALRQSEERLRARFKAIPVPTFSWQRVGEDFALIDYNDAAELITEGGVAAVVGKTARELYGDMPEILEDLESCFRDRKPVEREMLYRFRSRDGTAQFAVTYAFVPPDIVMVHAKDVTEETQAKEALRQSEQRFRALIENSSDMVALVGTDGIVTYASPSVRRILGYTTDESVGHHLQEIVHPDDYQRVSQEFAERLASPGGSAAFELRIRHSDGAWRWIDAVANNLIAEPGVGAVVLNCRDITEQKLARDALQRSEERQKFLLDTAPITLFTARATGNFGTTWVSESIERRTGFPAERFVQEPAFWASRVHPDDRQVMAGSLREIMEAGTVVGEHRWKCKDGSYRWFLNRATLVRDEQGIPLEMVGSWLDITERKQAEEALRQSEERFRALFEQASEGILVSDLEGRHLEVNPKACEMLGYTRKELLALDYGEILFPEDLATTPQLSDELRSRKTFRIDLRLRRKDGSAILAEISARMLDDGRVLGIARDITERKQAEEALRESEARYRSLTEEASDGIFAADMEGRCLEANSRACEMLGYTRKELLALTYKDVFFPEDVANASLLYDELRNGETIRSDRRLRRKDGTAVLTEISARMLEDGRVLAIVRDVSERTQTEAERDALLLQKEGLAQRLFQVQEEERRRVAYDIHDGPTQQLVAAGMYLESYRMKRAQRAPEAEAYLQRAANHLSSAARECRRIISDLRPSALDDFGLAAALKLYIKEVKERCGCPVTFRVSQSGVRHDAETETVLFRIAQEAVSNAIKHSGTDRLSVRLRETASKLILEVRDWGCGFEVAKAWKSKEGHRMGLVSMRERAELLGGALRIDSAPGQGTTVRVELRRDHLDAGSNNVGRETDVKGRRHATTNR